MLPDQEHITFLSALTYSQLATQSLDKTSRYKAIHKALNGSAKFWEKKMVGFPCKLRYVSLRYLHVILYRIIYIIYIIIYKCSAFLAYMQWAMALDFGCCRSWNWRVRYI